MPKTISSAAANVIAPDIGVLILAGGEATRLPDKLHLAAGHMPMIARVYRNVSPGRTTFISCKATFPAAIDALLPCPMVVDRWPLRGPLAGMISTMEAMTNRYVFAVAADAPFITAAFIDKLATQLRPGDEAVVPRHGASIEPLAALYDRAAFVRAGSPILASGIGTLRAVIARLATRFIDVETDEPIFANVNTPADYAAVADVVF